MNNKGLLNINNVFVPYHYILIDNNTNEKYYINTGLVYSKNGTKLNNICKTYCNVIKDINMFINYVEKYIRVKTNIIKYNDINMVYITYENIENMLNNYSDLD